MLLTSTVAQCKLDLNPFFIPVIQFHRYFQAASPTSIERNVYSIPIPLSAQSALATSEPKALSDTSGLSYHRASFSPQGGFFLLSNEGPGVPWQKLIEVGKKGVLWILQPRPH